MPRANPNAWIEAHLRYGGDDCLPWPFGCDKQGRGLLHIKVGGGRITRVASREMCIRTKGPPPSSEHHAAHNCGNGHLGCMNQKHLEWKTPSANCLDRVVHGTDCRGEKNNTSKLTREDVLRIREEISRGQVEQKELAKVYGVDNSTISDIRRRKSWAWLQPTF